MQNRYILLMGQVFNWEDKAPFVPSGKSVLGAVEYDKDSDTLKCHECGKWVEHLGNHVLVHDLTSREYKAKHGINLRSSMISRSASAALSRAARGRGIFFKGIRGNRSGSRPRARGTASQTKFELRNIRGTCRAQLIHRLNKLSEDLGRNPSSRDMKAAGLGSAEKILGTGWTNELRKLAGLEPLGRGKHVASRAVLLEVLRDFFVLNGRVPTTRDFRTGLLPDIKAYYRYFGCMANAYMEAGLVNSGIRSDAA